MIKRLFLGLYLVCLLSVLAVLSIGIIQTFAGGSAREGGYSEGQFFVGNDTNIQKPVSEFTFRVLLFLETMQPVSCVVGGAAFLGVVLMRHFCKAQETYSDWNNGVIVSSENKVNGDGSNWREGSRGGQSRESNEADGREQRDRSD